MSYAALCQLSLFQRVSGDRYSLNSVHIKCLRVIIISFEFGMKRIRARVTPIFLEPFEKLL